MKKIMPALFLILIAFCTSNCTQEDVEYKINRNTFIEDKANPGLPIYSELGYNAFGAYVDNSRFVSANSIHPSKIIIVNDTLEFTLEGTYQLEGSYGSTSTLKFRIPNFELSNYEELIKLDNFKSNLKTDKVEVFFNTFYPINALPILDGELHIKSAKNLNIDKELSRIVLSGTFYFKTLVNNNPITFYNGRFDISIGYENFYVLK